MSELDGAERVPDHVRLWQIQSLIDVRRPLDAVEVAHEGLMSDPGNARLIAAMGWAYLEATQVSDARMCLARSLAVDPDDAWTYGLLADALLADPQDRKGAVRAAEEACRRSPHEPAYRYTLVRAHAASMRIRRASAAADVLREMAPHSDLALLAGAVVALGRVDLLRARVYGLGVGLIVATRGVGVVLVPFLWLLHVAMRSRHLKRADALLQALIARQPNNSSVHLMAAEVMAQRFRFADSVNRQVTIAALDAGAVQAEDLARSIAQRVGVAIASSAATWIAVVLAVNLIVDTRLATVAAGLVLAAAIPPAMLRLDRRQTDELPPLIRDRVHRDSAPTDAALVVSFVVLSIGSAASIDGLTPTEMNFLLTMLVTAPIWLGFAATLVRRRRRANG